MVFLQEADFITLIINSMMGCSAYIGYQVNIKRHKLTLGYVIFTFLMALFTANLIQMALDVMGHENWKSIGILLGSFSSTYMIEWFDKDSTDIFRRIIEIFIGKRKNNDHDNYS